MCNSTAVRTFEILFSSLLICISTWVLWLSQRGKIKGIAFPRYFWLTGKDAKLASSVLAIFFILAGIFVLLSALLGLDC